jgi:hypothetical protein
MLRYTFSFLLITFLWNTTGFSQISEATPMTLHNYEQTKFYVVLLDNDPVYNEAIKNAMDQCWKVSEFKFTDEQWYKNHITDKFVSFLIPINRSGRKLAIFNGGNSNIEAFMPGDFVALGDFNLPFRSKANETYRMMHVIQSMNSAIEQRLSGDQTYKELMASLNQKSKELQNKTLLIDSQFVTDSNTDELMEEIKTLYPYSIQFVETSYIQKMIHDRSPDHAYLVAMRYIMDTEKGEVLSALESNSPNLKKAFKSLQKSFIAGN